VHLDVEDAVTTTKRFERTLTAARRRALDAVGSTVEVLRYPKVDTVARLTS
jgi:hypothetical protein